MAATLEELVEVNSQLMEEVLKYLDSVARDAAILPKYYPDHLRDGEGAKTRFDEIRQTVQVVEDRSKFEKWLAEEMERSRAAGRGFDRIAYTPARSRDESEEREQIRRGRTAPPKYFSWDEKASGRFKRAIILGDPGFGKTWLLKYEARLAREGAQTLRDHTINLDKLIFPISARLSEINQSDDPVEDALIALRCNGYSEAFRRFLKEKLETECCAVLLDALDEVPTEIPQTGQTIRFLPHYRQRLRQRLEAFASHFPNTRILLTSRNVGYMGSPIPDAKEFELLAFNWRQIESFAKVWFGDEERANKFLKMLRKNLQVRGLACIPLMLALMCKEYEKGKLSFPTRRVEIYDRCLRGLLRDWKEEKEIPPFGTDDIIELLEEVGYALFVENYEQFSEGVLRKKMIPYLDKLKSPNSLHDRSATEIIEELKLDGILITVGEDYLFLHLTFQEYLTACALEKRVKNNGKNDGWKLIEGLIDKKAWLPSWQEVIILLTGKLPDPTPLLKLLMDKKKDDYFRHRLALAALCMPEIPSTVDNWFSRTINQITEETFTLWEQRMKYYGEAAVPHLNRALPVLGQMNGQVNGEQLMELLFKLLHASVFSVRIAMQALKAMGEVAATPQVIEQLLITLNDSDIYVCSSAAETLGAMGKVTTNTKVIEELLIILGDACRFDSFMRKNATSALGAMGEAAAKPQVIEQLLIALNDPNCLVRSSAAKALMVNGVRIFKIRSVPLGIFKSKWEARSVEELSR
jgi:hypothetical protein